MSSATHTRNATIASPVPAAERRSGLPTTTRSPGASRVSGTFPRTVAAHLIGVPAIAVELAHWRRHAQRIPNTALRATALCSLEKRGNIEGAALFATLAPPRSRRRTIRALVAYQAAYNYLDTLSEQPSADPAANAEQLHQALLVALHPDACHEDYYRLCPEREDGGYLTAMLDTCRRGLAGLPSFHAVAPHARAAAARIIDFQTLTTTTRHGGEQALQAWAQQLTPPSSGLHWWETAAGAGSSLAVHALIAAAAHPATDPPAARRIDRAYFPELGALHSLLDSSVDRDEDARQGQPSLIAHYGPGPYAPIRLSWLASGAAHGLRVLPGAARHRVILTAMASYYLTDPESDSAEGATLTAGLTEALGPRLPLCMHLFRAKRLAHSLPRGRYA